MAKAPGSNKKMNGSMRGKAGLVAKAGKRRPPHKRDRHGKRQWEAA